MSRPRQTTLKLETEFHVSNISTNEFQDEVRKKQLLRWKIFAFKYDGKKRKFETRTNEIIFQFVNKCKPKNSLNCTYKLGGLNNLIYFGVEPETIYLVSASIFSKIIYVK